MIQNHPNRAVPDLSRKLVRHLACHGSILSGVGASGKPGAVHVGLQVATTDVPATDACPARKIPSVALFYAPNKDFVGKDSVQVELAFDAKILAAHFLITVQESAEK